MTDPNSSISPSIQSQAQDSGSSHQHPISTSSHPQRDPTVNVGDHSSSHGASRGEPATAASTAAELASLTISLRSALRQFPDFPSPGILFEDIMPIFANPTTHTSLIRALELHVLQAFGGSKPDIVVGLDARGFLFGPSLALRLNAGFVPVRKRGKLPGPTETASYKKEYGEDFFQLQSDAIKTGQKVLIVDDIIATGGSAYAAGSLVKTLGGSLMGYVFILELDFLKGRDLLDAPVYTLLSSQESALSSS
ncbi:adenine phosphoribosyltransferase [Microthyrium microscopicum]|uniref:adenine phosphoribosyltransferase n=1 Tax=Microthyrium microscopicum TaxID=703497 RepID=A0A6A6UAN6_9PEZI|nr:adenine phosphoribosyltransferase [Microthyrium microscopicum]